MLQRLWCVLAPPIFLITFDLCGCGTAKYPTIHFTSASESSSGAKVKEAETHNCRFPFENIIIPFRNVLFRGFLWIEACVNALRWTWQQRGTSVLDETRLDVLKSAALPIPQERRVHVVRLWLQTQECEAIPAKNSLKNEEFFITNVLPFNFAQDFVPQSCNVLQTR